MIFFNFKIYVTKLLIHPNRHLYSLYPLLLHVTHQRVYFIPIISIQEIYVKLLYELFRQIKFVQSLFVFSYFDLPFFGCGVRVIGSFLICFRVFWYKFLGNWIFYYYLWLFLCVSSQKLLLTTVFGVNTGTQTITKLLIQYNCFWIIRW